MVGLEAFVRQPILSTIVSVAVIIIKVVKLFALPIRRCPSVTPPAVVIDADCFNTDTRALRGDIVSPLRRTVGNIRSVACVASSTAGTNAISVAICFGRNASPSVTTMGMRGHISGTANRLPTRIARIKIAASGQRADVLRVFSLFDPSSSCSRAFLSGCVDVGLGPRVLHVSKMNSVVVVNNRCDLHM